MLTVEVLQLVTDHDINSNNAIQAVMLCEVVQFDLYKIKQTATYVKSTAQDEAVRMGLKLFNS